MAFNVARAGEHAYHMAAGGQGPAGQRPRPGEEFDEEAGEEPRQPAFRKQTSHYDLNFDEQLNAQHIKEGFIRKVYSILGIQMAYTALICGAMTFHPSLGMVGIWINQHQLLFFIPLICVVCGLTANKDKFPTNLILLAVLTTMLSLQIGGVCFFYYSIGKGAIILTSLILTSLVFFLLTAVVWTVGDKFGWMGNYLIVALNANIFLFLIGFFMGWSATIVLYNCLGIMIFTGYILYDTNQIVNKVRIEDADMGTAIMGAVELYLDIVNLFMHILSLLGRADS